MKKVILGLVAVALLSGCGEKAQQTSSPKKSEKYVLINGIVRHGKDSFEPVGDVFVPNKLGNLIGETDKGQQVYEVEKLKEEEWLLIREANGKEHLFKNLMVKMPSIKKFRIDGIELRKDDSLGASRTFFKNEKVHKSMNDYLKKKEVPLPQVVEEASPVYFTSREVPGINLNLLFLHDDKGNCFLFDSVNEKTWKIGHELHKNN